MSTKHTLGVGLFGNGVQLVRAALEHGRKEHRTLGRVVLHVQIWCQGRSRPLDRHHRRVPRIGKIKQPQVLVLKVGQEWEMLSQIATC